MHEARHGTTFSRYISHSRFDRQEGAHFLFVDPEFTVRVVMRILVHETRRSNHIIQNNNFNFVE
jgi:hypothetical protein